MAFYGRIINTSTVGANITFDKTYTNRRAADFYANSDNVMVGRCALVDYDQFNIEESFPIMVMDYYGPNQSVIDGEQVYYTDNMEEFYTKGAVSSGFIVKDSQGGAFFKCIGSDENVNVFIVVNGKDRRFKGAMWEEITSNSMIDGNVLYRANMLCDQYYAVLHSYKRLYDSTVWIKAYDNGVQKYTNIADLNGLVPDFEIRMDAPMVDEGEAGFPQHPTIGPYWGPSSNNLFYTLHMSPNWGFKVKEVDNNGLSDIETIEGKKQAIYFNNKGFNKEERTYDDSNENTIMLTKDGISGRQYYPFGSDDNGERQALIDTQQLTIQLPALGNAVSDLWDVVYGEDRKLNLDWIYAEKHSIDNIIRYTLNTAVMAGETYFEIDIDKNKINLQDFIGENPSKKATDYRIQFVLKDSNDFVSRKIEKIFIKSIEDTNNSNGKIVYTIRFNKSTSPNNSFDEDFQNSVDQTNNNLIKQKYSTFELIFNNKEKSLDTLAGCINTAHDLMGQIIQKSVLEYEDIENLTITTIGSGSNNTRRFVFSLTGFPYILKENDLIGSYLSFINAPSESVNIGKDDWFEIIGCEVRSNTFVLSLEEDSNKKRFGENNTILQGVTCTVHKKQYNFNEIDNKHIYYDPTTEDYFRLGKKYIEENATVVEEGNNYIVKEDPNNLFLPVGTVFNSTNIEGITLSELVGVKYNKIIEESDLIKIDINNHLDTLYGQILYINNLISDSYPTNQGLSRDEDTYYGMLNSIKDILHKFKSLKKNKLLITNRYGIVDDVEIDTRQEYGTRNKAMPEETTWQDLETQNAPYIQTNIDSSIVLNENENKYEFKNNFEIKHKEVRPLLTTTTKADKNKPNEGFPYATSGLNHNADNNLQLLTPIIDKGGHTIGFNTETVKLLNNFNKIETNNELESISLRAEDNGTLNINAGNNWIKIYLENNENENPTVNIAHTVGSIQENFNDPTPIVPTIDEETNSYSISIPHLEYDEAGHITTASNKQYEFSTDEILEWSTDNQAIKINHKSISEDGTTYSVEGNENTIPVPSISTDRAGHVTGVEFTEFELPKQTLGEDYLGIKLNLSDLSPLNKNNFKYADSYFVDEIDPNLMVYVFEYTRQPLDTNYPIESFNKCVGYKIEGDISKRGIDEEMGGGILDEETGEVLPVESPEVNIWVGAFIAPIRKVSYPSAVSDDQTKIYIKLYVDREEVIVPNLEAEEFYSSVELFSLDSDSYEYQLSNNEILDRAIKKLDKRSLDLNKNHVYSFGHTINSYFDETQITPKPNQAPHSINDVLTFSAGLMNEIDLSSSSSSSTGGSFRLSDNYTNLDLNRNQNAIIVPDYVKDTIEIGDELTSMVLRYSPQIVNIESYNDKGWLITCKYHAGVDKEFVDIPIFNIEGPNTMGASNNTYFKIYINTNEILAYLDTDFQTFSETFDFIREIIITQPNTVKDYQIYNRDTLETAIKKLDERTLNLNKDYTYSFGYNLNSYFNNTRLLTDNQKSYSIKDTLKYAANLIDKPDIKAELSDNYSAIEPIKVENIPSVTSLSSSGILNLQVQNNISFTEFLNRGYGEHGRIDFTILINDEPPIHFKNLEIVNFGPGDVDSEPQYYFIFNIQEQLNAHRVATPYVVKDIKDIVIYQDTSLVSGDPYELAFKKLDSRFFDYNIANQSSLGYHINEYLKQSSVEGSTHLINDVLKYSATLMDNPALNLKLSENYGSHNFYHFLSDKISYVKDGYIYDEYTSFYFEINLKNTTMEKLAAEGYTEGKISCDFYSSPTNKIVSLKNVDILSIQKVEGKEKNFIIEIDPTTAFSDYEEVLIDRAIQNGTLDIKYIIITNKILDNSNKLYMNDSFEEAIEKLDNRFYILDPSINDSLGYQINTFLMQTNVPSYNIFQQISDARYTYEEAVGHAIENCDQISYGIARRENPNTLDQYQLWEIIKYVCDKMKQDKIETGQWDENNNS